MRHQGPARQLQRPPPLVALLLRYVCHGPRRVDESDITDCKFHSPVVLDDSRLTFYAPDASFWMPAWDDNDRLVEDPQAEISLIYYARRSGLEDRVFRIKTERSSASTPEPRTSHNISNVEILSQNDSKIDLRFNWLTLSYRYKIVDIYFGVSFYTLETTGERPLIKAKKVVLKNDYIHHVVDIYHI